MRGLLSTTQLWGDYCQLHSYEGTIVSHTVMCGLLSQCQPHSYEGTIVTMSATQLCVDYCQPLSAPYITALLFATQLWGDYCQPHSYEGTIVTMSATQLWGDYCQPHSYEGIIVSHSSVISTHLTWLLMRMGTRLLLSQFLLWTAAMPSSSFLRTPTWVIPICNRWALFLNGTSCYKIMIMIIALISIVSYLTDKVSTLCLTR